MHSVFIVKFNDSLNWRNSYYSTSEFSQHIFYIRYIVSSVDKIHEIVIKIDKT